ncbi:MAG: tail-specific protease, partial [Xanthomonadaceae bacterium]|nr:tail-specific protease [Xanthomonadaceae bacterium]
RDAAKRKQRQEERKRLGLALDPLADTTDDGLQAGERNVAEDAAREKAAEKRPDPLLRESAAILADAIHLLDSDRKLSAQVLPRSTAPGIWAQ